MTSQDPKQFEINRETYDSFNEERLTYKSAEGLTEELVREISRDKNEPEWMLEIRLKGLKLFHKLPTPTWGPDLSKLDLSKIHYYLKPDAKQNSHSWDDVPDDIKNTFEKLGIPQAEREALGGVGAQYESEVVYHNLKKELQDKGVVFLDCAQALHDYPELMQKYFMTTCVPVGLHKFTALHAAVWSGGTFIYIPKGVKVEQPLQAYFRMNAQKGGQFEHTLIIVDEGAEVQYLEGCFLAGSLVSCDTGLKRIEDIEEGDFVLTSEGKYKQTKDLQRMPYTGRVAKIKTRGLLDDVNATEDHPILYVDRQRANERNKSFKPRWNTARYAKKNDYVCVPINQTKDYEKERFFDIVRYVEGEYQKVSYPVDMSPEFFRLIGYYLAEGSVSHNSYLNFSFHINEKEYIADVQHCLKKVFGVTNCIESKHMKNNGLTVVLCSVDIARLFKQFGTSCYTKCIPEWVLHEKPKLQAELINGFYRGDGNYYGKKLRSGFKESFRINTTSENLARQAQQIMYRLGIVSFLNKIDRSKTGRAIMYTIGITGAQMIPFGKIVGQSVDETINGKRRASLFSIDKKFAYHPIEDVTFSKVNNQEVYNFGVSDHETYVVGGIAVHNCSAPQYTQNSLHAGCVEIHVLKGARARYSSIENWSKNTYNLNTKRAIAYDDALIEWVNGNMGSGVTMLYPASVLKGNNSKSDFIGIALANKDQHQDTGCKITHIGKNTSSTITSKSISLNGGISTYRGIVSIQKGATNAATSVECDALMMDNLSQSNTYPYMDIKEKNVDVAHEAKVGKISEEQIFYLMSRGLSEEAATQMIVNGFIEPIAKKLPLEYAVELNRLIELEMEGSLG